MTTNAVLNLVSASMSEKLLAAARIEDVRESFLLVFKKTRKIDHFADFLLKNSEVMQLAGMLQNPLLFFEVLDPACYELTELPDLNQRMQGLGETRNLGISHADAQRIRARVDALPEDEAQLRARWSETFPGFDYDPLPEINKAKETLQRWLAMISATRIGVLRIRC